MIRDKKYDVSGLLEAQFELGSRGFVLKNLLHIKKKGEMDQIEAVALKQAEDACFRTYGKNHRFTANDIRKIHKLWLGKMYYWAGNYRQVNIGKGNFKFASATHIPQLMQEFEELVLSQNTPCNFKSNKEIINAIAKVHVELVLIHPFREGNGRIARLLATIMAVQSGLPPLDFSHIQNKKKQEYFAAVRCGLNQDYGPMEKIFDEVVKKTISRQESK